MSRSATCDWEYADQGIRGAGWRVSTRTQAQPDRPLSQARGRTGPARDAADADSSGSGCRREIERTKRLRDRYLPRAARYQDYRQMLDKQKDIDAVVVATPDHMHAPIALRRDGSRQARATSRSR